MTSPAQEAQLIISALSSTVLVSKFDMCSFTVLAYDHVLTLNLEISLIWRAPWNMGKVMYFLTPYLALVETGMNVITDHPGGREPSTHRCMMRYKARIWMLSIGISLAESVLWYRAWAMWGRTRKAGLMFLTSWVGAQIGVYWVVDRSLQAIQFVPRISSRNLDCILSHGVRKLAFLGYLILLIFEFTTLGLTFYITRSLRSRGSYTSNLYRTLYRDGVLYYVCLLAFSLVNIILVFLMPNRTPMVPLHRVVHAIVIKRMLLNLRHAASQDTVNGSPSGPYFTQVAFAPNEQTTYGSQDGDVIELDCRRARTSFAHVPLSEMTLGPSRSSAEPGNRRETI